jgi:hypothetical protein
MKLLMPATIILLLLFFCSCQDNRPTGTASTKTGTKKIDSLVFHDTLYNDTFFIYRYLDSEGYYTGIYLGKNDEKSKEYQQLMNFKLDSNDVENIAKDCKYEVDSFKTPIKKFNLSVLGYDWLPLVRYKKKYYWEICRFSNILTDSILIFDTQDGYHSVVLQSVTKPTPNEYALHYKGGIRDNSAEGDMNIYVLDPKTNLSVWENIENGYHEYALRIPKEYAKNYDFINVNSNGEPDEHVFEAIDGKKLIKESQEEKK